MGLFGKRTEQGPTVEARLLVVPGCTRNLDSGAEDGGNSNNLSIEARVKSQTTVRVSWAADGPPGDPQAQDHVDRIRNWVRILLSEAGGVGTISPQLPAEIHLPGRIDAATRRVVSIDWELAESELAPYRDVAREWWKVTEAPLADLRNLKSLPGDVAGAAKGIKSALSAMRRGAVDMVADMRAKPGPDGKPALGKPALGKPALGKPALGKPAWTEEEAETARRSAVMRRAALEHDPKTRDRVRRAMLDAGPRQAEAVRAGYLHPVDFEHWLMVEEVAGILTAEEASELRRLAGVGDPGTGGPEPAP